jgi:hypothetical protein
MKLIAWALIFSLTGCHAQILPLPSPNRKGGAAVWTKVNDKSSGLSSAQPLATAAFANPLTNGSLIVVTLVSFSAPNTHTPTDTAGNTYIDCGAGAVNGNVNNGSSQIFYALNTHTTSANVVSFVNPEPHSYTLTAMEFTGGAAASPVRAFAKNVNATAPSSTTLTSTAIAGTVAGDLIVGNLFDPGLIVTAAGSGYTLASDPNLMTEYNLSGAGGSIAATWTVSSTGEFYSAVAAAFKH